MFLKDLAYHREEDIGSFPEEICLGIGTMLASFHSVVTWLNLMEVKQLTESWNNAQGCGFEHFS